MTCDIVISTNRHATLGARPLPSRVLMFFSGSSHVHSFRVKWGEYSLDRRGGGVLSLEKGTDCGPTTAELWLSGTKIAKNDGLSSHYECA